MENQRVPAAHDETIRIAGAPETIGLSLDHRKPTAENQNTVGRSVLYVHGATFPSALAIGHRFDGYAWMDSLADAGFDVWALDFPGYGESDPYPEMGVPASAHPPLGRAPRASRQVEQAVRYICQRQNVPRVSLIAHSWGTMVAALAAGRIPDLIDRLALFAPIARRDQDDGRDSASLPAYRYVSLQDQWDRFTEDVPAGEPPVLLRRHFDVWGTAYLASDPTSEERLPASVRTPSGAWADIFDAWHGYFPYDPAAIRAPTLIIRGAWDSLCTDTDAGWLFEALRNAPLKRDVKISRGTHLLHLEENRYQLYQEVQSFLAGHDELGTLRTPQGGDHATMTTSKGEQTIPGYTYGTAEVARSPITLEEWEQMKKSAFFSEEDVFYLRLSRDVLADQVDGLLATWRGIIFDHPHLRAYDENPSTGQVDTDYAAAVAKRFGQWVLDTAAAKYDQAWLDYQYEIGLRHHRTKKNETDNGHTLGHIRARDLIPFSAAIIAPMKPFLASKGHSDEIVDRMYDAWWKIMILTATLWSQPYIKDGDF